MEKLKIKEAIIVEGIYDKNKLSQIVDTLIIVTDGFSVFNNKNTVALIKKVATESGIIILTDSDSAGFAIRNYIKSFVDECNIKNVIIPQISGREKRKSNKSKEGFLGVEGIPDEIIRNLLINATDRINDSGRVLTYSDLYELGYVGKQNSRQTRNELLKDLNLPNYINVKDLLKYINSNKEVQECLFRNLEKCI